MDDGTGALIVGVLVVGFVALVALFVASRNAVTICVLEVRAGVVVVTRGAVAEGVLADLRDVLGRPPVRWATVRVSRARGHAELEIRGEVSDAQKQQLRNVIGRLPLAKLANARVRTR